MDFSLSDVLWQARFVSSGIFLENVLPKPAKYFISFSKYEKKKIFHFAKRCDSQANFILCTRFFLKLNNPKQTNMFFAH